MAKLKFDRSINFKTGKNEVVTIPNDEVWKVLASPINGVKINGIDMVTSQQLDSVTTNGMCILGGGATINRPPLEFSITGVAFKVIKEE